MSAALNAANKLRLRVLKVPGTVLLVEYGAPDRVIRIENLKEIVPDVEKRIEDDKRPDRPCLYINLDSGPGQELWSRIKGTLQARARRDKLIPEPLAVSNSTREEWMLDEDDVPYVEMEKPVAAGRK